VFFFFFKTKTNAFFNYGELGGKGYIYKQIRREERENANANGM